jgi:hypothetical protein
MPATVFNTFAEVQNALQTFVQNNNIQIASAIHQNFWERGSTLEEQYNNFVTGQVFLPNTGYPTTGFPILQKGNGKASNIILALSGLPPFDGSTFNQMPQNGPYLDQETIGAISAWIDAGANQ